MVQLVERKVRSRAQQIYEDRGQSEGKDLQDWFQAESEILEKSILAPLYRRLKSGGDAKPHVAAEISAQDASCPETA